MPVVAAGQGEALVPFIPPERLRQGHALGVFQNPVGGPISVLAVAKLPDNDHSEFAS
jgi:hypothetical protein